MRQHLRSHGLSAQIELAVNLLGLMLQLEAMPPSASSLLVVQAVLRENGERRFYTACVNGFHWRWNAQSQLVKLRSSSYELFSLWVRFGRGEANESLRGKWSPRQSTMATITPSAGR